MRLVNALTAIGLLDAAGKPVADVASRLAGKRVGLYFAAGWCPMCTGFEPSLLEFRQRCSDTQKPIELIYVPSDRSADDALGRAKLLSTLSVPFGSADQFKTEHKVWAGAERGKLGNGRRSGVPAIVVLSPEAEELAFVDAEASGPRSLIKWDLDQGVFGS
jgi:nucleoredoxin